MVASDGGKGVQLDGGHPVVGVGPPATTVCGELVGGLFLTYYSGVGRLFLGGLYGISVGVGERLWKLVFVWGYAVV